MEYTISSGQKIQDLLDERAAPGATFIVKEGTYDGFRISGATLNGTADAPITIKAEGEVWLEPFDSEYEDTIRIVDADHIHIEGFNILGVDNGRRQAVHVHSSPLKGRYSHGFILRDCKIYRVRGDGVKLSETYDSSVTNCQFLPDRQKDEDERHLDFNKFANGVVRGCLFKGHKAINMKGGGVGGVIENCTFVDCPKAIEIGGYEGSGYWDQINNLWAAKDILISGNSFKNSPIYDLRFIDAHDCVAEDNGELDYLFTSSVESGRGKFRCERLLIDGKMMFDLPETVPPADEPAPTPVEPPKPKDPYRFEAGEGGKKVIKPRKREWPTVTLVGFDEDEVDELVTFKGKNTVLMDLRKIKGPRLTFKGRGARDAWADNVIYE